MYYFGNYLILGFSRIDIFLLKKSKNKGRLADSEFSEALAKEKKEDGQDWWSSLKKKVYN